MIEHQLLLQAVVAAVAAVAAAVAAVPAEREPVTAERDSRGRELKKKKMLVKNSIPLPAALGYTA